MAPFPHNFLWGAATAGHQVEGGNVNADLWPMEWAPDSTFNEPSGDACDHYHRYPGDIALLADLGLNAYRFSLEWSRIEPEPGFYSPRSSGPLRTNDRELPEPRRHTRGDVQPLHRPPLDGRQRRMESGGCTRAFRRLRLAVTQDFGDLLSWVCTLNEPNLMAMMRSAGVLAMGTGDRPPATKPVEEERGGIGGYDPTRYRMGIVAADLEQMARAHRLAAQAIKSTDGSIRVGWTLALVDLQSAEGGEERWLEARRLGQTNWLNVSAEDDFVGVQTYSRSRIGADGQLPVPEGVATMQTGWEVYPEALGHTVRLASEHAGVPVLVTENGMATDDDAARLAYTRDALEGLAQCLEDGVDVRGYIHWTLLDNFEWNAGFSKTFGLVAVDRETFVRSVKPSARWLGQVAQRNGLV